ncbi:MAG: cytochrome c biogenesis protein [Anaerolineae bacterium]
METTFRKQWPTGLTVLTVIAGAMLAASLAMIFLYAPMEQNMGWVQRIFYTHVGSAWAGAVGFVGAVVMAVLYLATRSRLWDVIGHASVEVGLALVTVGLVGGMVWGNQVWGVPWTWDPKLTSFAVMWLSYAAYLMLREGIEDPERRQRFEAVYAIVAVATVLFTYLGVRLVETTLHPHVIGPSAATGEGDFGLSTRMVQTLIFAVVTWTVIYATLLWHRSRLRLLRDSVDQARANLIGGRSLAAGD